MAASAFCRSQRECWALAVRPEPVVLYKHPCKGCSPLQRCSAALPGLELSTRESQLCTPLTALSYPAIDFYKQTLFWCFLSRGTREHTKGCPQGTVLMTRTGPWVISCFLTSHCRASLESLGKPREPRQPPPLLPLLHLPAAPMVTTSIFSKARLSIQSHPLWPLGIQPCRGAEPGEQHSHPMGPVPVAGTKGTPMPPGTPVPPLHGCTWTQQLLSSSQHLWTIITRLPRLLMESQIGLGWRSSSHSTPCPGRDTFTTRHEWLWHLSLEQPGGPSSDPEQALLGFWAGTGPK